MNKEISSTVLVYFFSLLLISTGIYGILTGMFWYGFLWIGIGITFIIVMKIINWAFKKAVELSIGKKKDSE